MFLSALLKHTRNKTGKLIHKSPLLKTENADFDQLCQHSRTSFCYQNRSTHGERETWERVMVLGASGDGRRRNSDRVHRRHPQGSRTVERKEGQAMREADGREDWWERTES